MPPDPTLTFLGGAGTVTGSRFLLQLQDLRILVDAGLFQGLRALRRRNWDPFPVPADLLDAVVVSHAHLDHVGYLPALVQQGFRGPVVATPWTVDLARIVLADSAKLQELDAANAAARGYSRHRSPRPLYTRADAEQAMERFQPAMFGAEVELAPDAAVTLRRAGHILGSACPLVRIGGTRVQFSGDLGRGTHPLLLPPEPPAACDVLVVESTYGDRRHRPQVIDELGAAIARTIGRGGSAVIPAFAVDRTEVLLAALRTLIDACAIPAVPIWVDSPMALAAYDVYQRAAAHELGDLQPGVAAELMAPPNLRAAASTADSIALNDPAEPSIIVSAAGMATGGRVLHHLKAMLPRREHSVLLVGYQAVGTRGRDLLHGARAVKIHGVYVPVRAEVVDLTGFSVHADADELVAWVAAAPHEPAAVYVVHGEPESSRALADRICDELGWLAVVPRDGERVRLPGAAAPAAVDRPISQSAAAGRG
jgi:metallo-beta-lactamase family protein